MAGLGRHRADHRGRCHFDWAFVDLPFCGRVRTVHGITDDGIQRRRFQSDHHGLRVKPTGVIEAHGLGKTSVTQRRIGKSRRRRLKVTDFDGQLKIDDFSAELGTNHQIRAARGGIHSVDREDVGPSNQFALEVDDEFVDCSFGVAASTGRRFRIPSRLFRCGSRGHHSAVEISYEPVVVLHAEHQRRHRCRLDNFKWYSDIDRGIDRAHGTFDIAIFSYQCLQRIVRLESYRRLGGTPAGVVEGRFVPISGRRFIGHQPGAVRAVVEKRGRHGKCKGSATVSDALRLRRKGLAEVAGSRPAVRFHQGQ
jgi:hypothetical protein